MRSLALASRALVYLGVVLPLSLVAGVVRTWFRFQAGTLPNQYLVQSTFINAGLVLLFAVLCLPVYLGVSRSKRHHSDRPIRTAWMALACGLIFFLFWGVNTGIGFRVLGEALAGETEPVVRELSWWLPAMLAFMMGGFLLARRASPRRVLLRGGVLLAAALLTVGGYALYSETHDPSLAAPLHVDQAPRRTPHVFIVLVDTLRADHLGAYGYEKPTSPHVDTLAAESVVYERAFAPSPWTRPSCGSLLTSRYPPEIGLDGMFKALPAEIAILPQFLKHDGYRTAGIVSSVHLSAQFGFDKGWDLLDIGTTYLQWTGTRTAFSRLGLVPWGETYPRYDARQLTDRAIDWLSSNLADAGPPVFMYLHYSDPHAPYRPPASEDRWREFARPEVVAAVEEPPFSPTWGGRTLSPVEVEAMVARYDSEIAYFDQELARFLDHLRQLGIYDRSLIVFTSDHGEEFGEHGGWAHAHSLYNELIHVPLIVKYPKRFGIASGQRVGDIASLVDVVPTIHEALGAGWSDSGFRGRSLLTRKPATDDYAVFSKADGHGLRSVVQGDDKIIQEVRDDEVVDEVYFSLSRDFAEQGDGSLPPGFEAENLAKMRLIAAGIDGLTFAADENEITLDAETLRELKALGYIN